MGKVYKSEKFDRGFVDKNMMGPNALIIVDELLEDLSITSGMRVLDLGCGNGLTSIYLAKEFDVQVFAVDLWVSATDNYKRFLQMGVDDLVIPIHADAHELPFAHEYFDALISIDAYHYFGNNDEYFDKYLRPLLKKDALVSLAFPGMKYEVHNNIPDEMKKYWGDEELGMWHSLDWWKEKLEGKLKNFEAKEMKCFDKAWDDWLSTENPYAIEDREMMAADNGRYMNIISITGKTI